MPFVISCWAVFLFAGSLAGQISAIQAMGPARAQVAMIEVDGSMAAGIIVGHDDRFIYVATAAHLIPDRKAGKFPDAKVEFDHLENPRTGKFGEEIKDLGVGDLAYVRVPRDAELNRFVAELDFAILSPTGLGVENSPVDRFGFGRRVKWSGGQGDTLIGKTEDSIRFRSRLRGGESGGGLYNESWELIGMPYASVEDVSFAHPIDSVIKTLEGWKVPVRLVARDVKKRARGAEEVARLANATADARRLTAIAGVADDPEIGMLAALRGALTSWTASQQVLPETEREIHRLLGASPLRSAIRGAEGHTVVDWNPNGQHLAIGQADGKVIVINVREGSSTTVRQASKGKVRDLRWSADGSKLAWTSDQAVFVWSSATPAAAVRFADCTHLAWNLTGNLAIGCRKEIRILDEHTGKVKKILGKSSDDSAFSLLAWSPKGDKIAVLDAGGSPTIKILKASDGKLLLTLGDLSETIECLNWSPSGGELVTCSGFDNEMILWNVTAGKRGAELNNSKEGHADGVMSSAWSSDGKKLLAGGGDGSVIIWDVATRAPQRRLYGHLGSVGSVAWAKNGTHLATADGKGVVRVWSLSVADEAGSISGSAIKWAKGTDAILVNQGGGELREFDVPLGTGSRNLASPKESILSASVSGRWLATESGLWDTASKAYRLTWAKKARVVSFSSDESRVAVADEDLINAKAEVWDLTKMEKSQTLDTGSDTVGGVSFSPLESYRLAVAVGSLQQGGGDNAYGDLQIWNLKNHQRDEISGASDRRTLDTVLWSADGKKIATDSSYSTAKIWNATSMKEEATLLARSREVIPLAWSPDGTRLATGGDAGTVTIWDSQAGDELFRLESADGVVHNALWSPSGKYLAVTRVGAPAGTPATVKIYAMDPLTLIDLARSRITTTVSDKGCKKYFRQDVCVVPALGGK